MIFDKVYDLLTYRNMQYSPDMPAMMLFYFWNKLLADSNKKKLDPFPGKYIAKAPDQQV